MIRACCDRIVGYVLEFVGEHFFGSLFGELFSGDLLRGYMGSYFR